LLAGRNIFDDVAQGVATTASKTPTGCFLPDAAADDLVAEPTLATARFAWDESILALATGILLSGGVGYHALQRRRKRQAAEQARQAKELLFSEEMLDELLYDDRLPERDEIDFDDEAAHVEALLAAAAPRWNKE